jgi:fatty acid desaturase
MNERPTEHTTSRAALHDLHVRRDAPGVARVLGMWVVLAPALAATAHLHAQGNPVWWLAALIAAAAHLMMFPAMHEAAHGTAFASAWLNRAVTAMGAFFMLQSPTFFREFHWEHHRSTQDPERDPEIGGHPEIVGEWPRNPLHYLAVACGQMLLVVKAGFTLLASLPLPAGLWQWAFPYIKPELRARVAWESRAVAAGYALALIVGFEHVDGFAGVVAVWPLSHVLLGLFVMPEHTGLPVEGSQFDRTRTIHTNALLRWCMWNMPYHAEHHAHPAVPFHAAAELHRRIRGELRHEAPGYLAFHRQALRRSLALGAD